MITKRNTLRCDKCGKMCRYFDEYTPFGCSSYDPPKPLEPFHICEKCFPKVKREWLKIFKEAKKEGKIKISCGDWQKSRAEQEAAKECGWMWAGSNGVGILGTEYFLDSYNYYPEKVVKSLSKLPYWGWCLTCGSKRTGEYCSNKKCKKAFKANQPKTEK